MAFQYHCKGNIVFEKGCVLNHVDEWALGKRAMVVTGAHSGRSSGALADVESALKTHKIPFDVFEGVENNPSVEQCRMLGKRSRDFGADFVVAVGGGSPLDAAKAIAVFACEDVDTEALFSLQFENILPIVAIPTTSGTGSEVTPWSVLTRHDLQTKRSFGNAKTLPAVALLDPNYTESLPKKMTLDTAMDACTHCMESVLTTKASPVTDALCLEGLRLFAPCMDLLEQNRYGEVRTELMQVSLLGGMAIAHTGTTLMHGMGYPLTYYHGLSHGEANSAVMPGYLRYVERKEPLKLRRILAAMQTDIEELSAYTMRNFPLQIRLTEAEIARYAEQTLQQGSAKNIDPHITAGEIAEVFRAALSPYLV